MKNDHITNSKEEKRSRRRNRKKGKIVIQVFRCLAFVRARSTDAIKRQEIKEKITYTYTCIYIFIENNFFLVFKQTQPQVSKAESASPKDETLHKHRNISCLEFRSDVRCLMSFKIKKKNSLFFHHKPKVYLSRPIWEVIWKKKKKITCLFSVITW